MTRFAIHHQSAVALSHAATVVTINQSQPEDPTASYLMR